MQSKIASKAASALAMGFLFGSYIHYDYVNWGRRGRDVFLAHQIERFDHYMINPRPAGLTIFSATLVMVGALAFYELAAFAFSKLFSAGSGQPGI